LFHAALQHDWILSMSLAVATGWVAAGPPSGVLAQYRSRFAVAGIQVAIHGDTAELVGLGTQLASFAGSSGLSADTDADIDLEIEWTSKIEPARSRQLFHSGCLWSVHEHGDGFLFDFTTQHLGRRPYKRLIVDRELHRARVILNRECLTEADAGRALEYPLDELLITHHLSLGRGVELHGCGMVREDGASFLFVGHSGAGKSTTAGLWTEHVPVEVLSDDRIIVTHRPNVPRLLSGSSSADFRQPHTKVSDFVMHGTPWHGEAAFASPRSAPLHRIFLLEHGSKNYIEPLSRSAAAGELLARSFTPFYQSRFVDPVLAMLDELVDAVPCYRFHFVPDQSAVETILEFRD
jgi:hypothetical protein